MSEQAQNLNENEELVEEVQQETTATEDPLEEAIARVQELEEQLKAQVEETSKKEQDLLLRTRAEIDNMRRRSEQDIEKAHKFALEKFSKDILNTIDNLERALATPANKEDENIKGFLFIVTRNIVFNKNKKRVNENLFKTSVLVAYGNEGYYNSTTVEEDYCASQLKNFIDRLINSLPEQQRKCFLLSREENLSYKEIAERLGISQKTVEIHMGKALKFLKDKVKRGWEILLSLLSF
mgnify:CR=1 FL=1